MDERFLVTEIYICPVDIVDVGIFKPNLEYPVRHCVIDKERQIAIDVKTNLKYDYIETKSNLYFMHKSYQKIKEDKRVAMFPLLSFGPDVSYLEEVKKIIERLKNNDNFQDGNEVFNNKQYLEYINQENEMENNNQKVKKFGKRKK